MKLSADDWKFITPTTLGCVVAVDLFLDNGQHARLEVFPLFYAHATGEQIPEIIVYCEMPGEKLHQQTEVKRWISRPLDKSCPWSSVELTPTLIRQINETLDAAVE